MQSLAPSSPVFPLAVAPIEQPAMEVPHLLPAPLLVRTQRGLRPVEVLRGLLADLRILVIAQPIKFRLRGFDGCLELLGQLSQFGCFDAEGAIHLDALL